VEGPDTLRGCAAGGQLGGVEVLLSWLRQTQHEHGQFLDEEV